MSHDRHARRRCRGVGRDMNGEAEETRELEVAYPVGTLHVRYPVGTLAISEDNVERGQGSRRARGQVREAAGRVAGVDDDGPAARQGEHELGPRAGGAGKQQARRRANRGAPRRVVPRQPLPIVLLNTRWIQAK